MPTRSDDFINELLQSIQSAVDNKTRLFEYSGSETVREAFNDVAEEIGQLKTLFAEKTEHLLDAMLTSHGIISSPSILHGEPVIMGTKMPVSTVAEHVNKYGVPQTVENFFLTREQVLDACWYAAVCGVESIRDESGDNFYRNKPYTRKWNKKWGEWAEDSRELFEQSLYEEILDPYTTSSNPTNK